jgi:Mlc titration factor MtfA (ptsG expression regulator)
MFDWLRRRKAVPTVPDEMWAATMARFPFLGARSMEDQLRLRGMSAEFLARKEFHGAGGLAITDDIALAIAAQAVLPVLHLGLHWYDDFVGIVVHPDEVVAKRTDVDEDGVVHHWEEVIAGEAMEGGPVMLSWRDVQDAGVRGETYNVVVHEFVHKIDMRDGAPDGCPPLPSPAARRAWMDVMQREYDAFRERVIVAERFGGQATWLDPYGAESIDEFFAVAAEGYFVDSARFTIEHPALAGLFDGFFSGATGS